MNGTIPLQLETSQSKHDEAFTTLLEIISDKLLNDGYGYYIP